MSIRSTRWIRLERQAGFLFGNRSIRGLIVEGTREGLNAARGRGARLGRPPTMTAEQIRHARDLLARPDNAVSSHRPAARRQPRHHLQLRPRGHHRAPRRGPAVRTGVQVQTTTHRGGR